MMKALRHDKLLMFATIFVAAQVMLAIFAPIVGGDPIEQVIMARMKGPSFEYLLGTDQLGRDILARILFGYRTSLITCGLAVLLALVVGGSLGMLAAFYRGWFDRLSCVSWTCFSPSHHFARHWHHCRARTTCSLCFGCYCGRLYSYFCALLRALTCDL